MKTRAPWLALPACLLLAACQSRTGVSATGNAPAQYAHVYLTVTQVGFNTSATAEPGASGWSMFTLPAPQTVDLVALANGTLAQFASQLKLAGGTYARMMLVLAGTQDALAASASALGAATDDEVDYYDAGGTLRRAALQVPNAATGISFGISLHVVAGTAASGATGFGAAFGTATTGASTYGNGTYGNGTYGNGTYGNGTYGNGTYGANTYGANTYGNSTYGNSAYANSAFGTPAATGIPMTTSSPVAPVSAPSTASAVVDFDATRDLRPLSLSGTAAFALDPHPTAVDAGHAGTIAGTVDLSAVSALGVRGVPDVQVAAETLSADGSRHVAVKTTLVAADGTFALYPLSTLSGAPATYDVVIHGPALATVIIKSVPVAAGAPGTATAQLATIPLTAAGTFAANVNGSQPVAPAAATVGFYQTLPLRGEVPYLVEQRATDPFSGVFTTDATLSGGSLQYATYAGAGAGLALLAATPAEGRATYHVAALDPAYGPGPLATTVSAPVTLGSTALFSTAGLPQPAGATADTISGTLVVGSPGANDKGELLLTRDGALVATLPLDGYLAQASSPLTFGTQIPGGGSSPYAAGVYQAEVWTWSSANPAGTLVRTPYGAAIDLSGGSATGITLTAP